MVRYLMLPSLFFSQYIYLIFNLGSVDKWRERQSGKFQGKHLGIHPEREDIASPRPYLHNKQRPVPSRLASCEV